MGWLWSAMASGAGALAGVVAQTSGHLLTRFLVTPLLKVIMALLSATVFSHESVRSGVFGEAAQQLWNVMAGLSGGVALFGMSWIAFQIHASALTGRHRWQEAVEGLMVYGLTLAGGFALVGTLLHLNNVFVHALVADTGSLIQNLKDTNWSTGLVAAGAGIGAVAMFGEVLGPLVLLLIGLLLLFAVITWAYRLFELVVFTGTLPITAAAAVAGYRQALDWNVQEVLGAIFSQLVMAVVWYTTWLIVGGHFVGPGASLQNLVVGCVGFYSMTRAPQWLQGIIGHRHAGLGSIAGGVFAGEALSGSVRSLVRTTPLGAGLGAITQGMAERAQYQAASWGGGKSLGERLHLPALGSRIAQGSMAKAARTAGERAEATPGLGLLARGGKTLAHGIGHGVRPARNLLSYAVQPRVTLGRHVENAYSLSASAREGTAGIRASASLGAIGPTGTMTQQGINPHELGRRLGAPPEVGQDGRPVAFRLGSSQRGVYARAKHMAEKRGMARRSPGDPGVIEDSVRYD